jgi:hypothetical protein
MVKLGSKAKPALLALSMLLLGGFAMAGCGSDDDDKPAQADCSACSADLMSTCGEAAKACSDDKSVSEADCQAIVDALCSGDLCTCDVDDTCTAGCDCDFECP